MPFKLGMGEYLSGLTADMSVWAKLLVTFVGWDSPILGVRVNLLQYSSGIGISDELVGFWLGYDFGFPLGDLIYYET